MKPIKVKAAMPMPKPARKPGASRPHFKRAKMSVLGKSAYGTGRGKLAFPPAGGAMMGGSPAAPGGADPGAALGGGAPMPPNVAPDNIGG